MKKIIEPMDKKLKEININLYTTFNYNKSVIMKENELDFIQLEIKKRINKEIKEIKKLYQATIDGEDRINFHSKCDNIPYTLVIIKSAGNRRFGGFTSQSWSKNGENLDDQNAFLFSLDKQKIYPYKNNGNAIYNDEKDGPRFGNDDIKIGSNCIKEKDSYTNISNSDYISYNYNGDNNALSEDGDGNNIYISD